MFNMISYSKVKQTVFFFLNLIPTYINITFRLGARIEPNSTPPIQECKALPTAPTVQ